MAVLTVQDAAIAGLAETFAAAAGGGDSFANNGLCLLHIKNASGAPITVTVDDPGSPAPAGATQFNPDVAVIVPAAGERLIGPFPPFRFNDSNGRVNLTYSGVTTLTVAVVRIRP